MGKGRKGRNSDNKTPKKRASHHEDAAANDMMDDEIDACKSLFGSLNSISLSGYLINRGKFRLIFRISFAILLRNCY